MSVFDDVVNVAKPYLGPAAEKFVSRQVKTHLKIDESQLTGQHMNDLAKWCFTSGTLLMGDAKAQEFSDKVRAIR